MARWIAVALCLLLLPTPSVLAKPKHKDKHKDKDEKGPQVVVLSFSREDRDNVRLVFVEQHGRGKCPPGLAKKGNGCLPPGQAKKRYGVGKVLARDVEVREVPKAVVAKIGAPPAGYRYVIVDGDLVKLAVGTMLVVDAIDGLVD